MTKNIFSPNHYFEVILYEYFVSDNYEINNNNEHILLREEAIKYQNKNDYLNAIKFYNKSIELNPIDIDTLFGLAQIYHKIGKLEKLIEFTQTMYNYCYTRSDIAKYYRLLGNYYIEIYKPDIAGKLFEYSNYFYKSESADNNLQYISKALKKSIANTSIEDLIEYIRLQNLPTQPNKSTLGLLYLYGKKEIQVNYEYGKKLLLFLYELTKDEEVAQIIGIK